jgi:nucleotide-binding universal stress UspA family protein
MKHEKRFAPIPPRSDACNELRSRGDAPVRSEASEYRVVVGFDGSPSSEHALAYAAGVARRLDTGLVVAHVSRPQHNEFALSVGVFVTGFWMPPEWDQARRQRGEESKLSAQVLQVLGPTTTRWTLARQRDSSTRRALRAIADEFSADVIVVGKAQHLLVGQATNDRGIVYPVAIDNDYEVWNAFDNHYWPALYFADRDGVIRDHHFGEGRYEQSERVIQQLLDVERDLISVEGLGVEAEADWDHLRTPESYLGYGRSEHFASPGGAAFDERRTCELPMRLRSNHWALAGQWTISQEKVVLDRAGGSIAYRYHARDAHLVLAPGGRPPIPFRLLLDGEAPGDSHGVDVDKGGNGLLREGRLYQLVREHDAVRERTLEITFLEPGAEAYSFTFG